MPILRKAYYGDTTGIRRIYESAFRHGTEADLVDRLRKTDRITLSLVAETDRILAGHILYSPAAVDDPDIPMAALGPMAVLPQYQRRGTGTLLVRNSITICREMGIKALVVLGHPRFYPRFGFSPASGFGLIPPWNGIPDEAFMVMELVKGSLKDGSGTVRYDPAFDLAVAADQGL